MLELQVVFVQPLLYAASTGKVDAATNRLLEESLANKDSQSSQRSSREGTRQSSAVFSDAAESSRGSTDSSGIADNIASLRAGRGIRTKFMQSSSFTTSDLTSGLAKMAAKKSKIVMSRVRGSIMEIGGGVMGGVGREVSQTDLLVQGMQSADVKVVLSSVAQMIMLQAKLLSDLVDATGVLRSSSSKSESGAAKAEGEGDAQVPVQQLKEKPSISDATCAGSILESSAELLHIFSDYSEAHSEAHRSLAAPCFGPLRANVRDKCGGRTWEELLGRPLDYVIQFLSKVSTLRDVTDTEHPDRAPLEAAATKITEALANQKMARRERERHREMVQLSEQMVGKKSKALNLLDTEALPRSDRRFVIRCGVMTKVCRFSEKPFDFILFSDMLLYGHSSEEKEVDEGGDDAILKSSASSPSLRKRNSLSSAVQGITTRRRSSRTSFSSLSTRSSSRILSSSRSSSRITTAPTARLVEFKFSRLICLTQIEFINEFAEGEAPGGHSAACCFVISIRAKEIILICASTEEKLSWISSIRAAQRDEFARVSRGRGQSASAAAAAEFTDDDDDDDDEEEEDDDTRLFEERTDLEEGDEEEEPPSSASPQANRRASIEI